MMKSAMGTATLPHDFAGIGAMVSALGYAIVSFDWRIACRHPPYVFTEVKMPDYRRFRVPGGTYFFTVNLLELRFV